MEPIITGSVKRKLTAILSADAVGYSRLMNDDEEATLKTLNTHRALMTKHIEQHRGRVVDTTGDNLLAEFTSAVDAVTGAVEIQRELAAHNAELSAERRMLFRIGINVGDVIEEKDRIYGDGVNIAARVEGLAKEGGICISGRVYDQVENKLDLAYEFLGDQKVKNITRPVKVYRVQLETETAVSDMSERIELPDKPSVAVLPFNNMSGDPEQNYFADGISEDITTELSRFHSIFVISRNSAFTYRGEAVDVRQAGQELGVEYIVEGSVRKAGRKIRITAQLIAVATGHHVWADRYDREMEDLFAVQDEITETIVSTLVGRIEAADIDRAKRKTTENMVAYDYLLRGLDFHKSGRISMDDSTKAVEMFTKAVELDPGFARAHAWLACATANLWPKNPSREQYDVLLDNAMTEVQKALSLDENECEAHRIMGAIYLQRRQFDRAEYHYSKAVALNPNYAYIAAKVADFLSYTGRPQEAEASVKRAMRLNPHHPDWYWQELGLAYYVGGQYEEAIRTFNRITNLVEFDYTYLAACCAELGEIEKAKSYIEALLRLMPGASVKYFEETQPFKNNSDLKRLLDALRKAGLPD